MVNYYLWPGYLLYTTGDYRTQLFSCIKLKTTCAQHTLALSLNSLQLSMNCAIMTSLYPDSTQSPLESTRSGIWAQRYGALFLVTWKKLPRCPPSSITSEKWVLVCYQMTITVLTSLFAFLNFFILFLFFIRHLYILYIVLPNFLFAYTVHRFFNFSILIFCFCFSFLIN